MIQLYFRQAWNLLKQEPFFSTIYIIGTGLSISMVMALSIVLYIKVANIYPETSRDRLLLVKSATVKKGEGWISSGRLSYQTVEACFRNLEYPEAITIEYLGRSDLNVQPEGTNQQLPVTVKYADDQFWKVFSFSFKDGKPFTEADFQSGVMTAVISESLSKKLYGTVEATGKYISCDFKLYRIAGVVKDVSFAMPLTYADIWVPYTTSSYYRQTEDELNALGSFRAYILAPSISSVPDVKQEVLENVRKYSFTLGDNIDFTLLGQPDIHWKSIFRYWSNSVPDIPKVVLTYGMIFFILLLIPAISLSGMIDSRMERRMAELGVRRAFGAPTTTIVKQVISENLLYTLLGGLLGLLLSYLLILFGRDWILTIGQSFVDILSDSADLTFTPSMLFNVPVFVISLVVCFILNVFSSLIPAWRSSRQQIIYSLNGKQ